MKLVNWIAIAAALVAALSATSAWISSKRARKVTASGQIGAVLIELNQIFVEQPELRPYFIEGGKLPKGQEQKAKALASMYLNILETVWSVEDNMSSNEQVAWTKYIRHQIRTVPIVNDLYEKQKEWYPNLNIIMNK
jgi:hypothetical protein